ncbi:NlpC/P60 family protein [Streptomyces sp. NPDC001984]
MAPESRDEVRQRIDSLYDQAENATGNYNATRARTSGTRGRGVPLRKNRSARTDPDLDQVTRQWFDAARAKLGPTVPAALPNDRRPQRPAEDRPKAQSEDELRGAGPELTGRRRMPELPAGPSAGALDRPLREPAVRPVAELTAGSGGSTGPDASPTGRLVAALPAVPGPRREPEAPKALPARAAEPRRPSPGTAKERNRRKLAVARDLLSRYAVQRTGPIAAIEARPTDSGAWSGVQAPVEQPTEEEWRPPSWAVGLGVATPSSTDTPRGTADALGMPDPLGTSDPLGTPDPLGLPDALGPSTWAEPGSFAAPSPTTDIGTFLTTALTDTGSFAPVGIGSAPDALYGGNAGKAVAFAREQIGRPCLWGATGPDSYDYASLTQAAWKAAGVALPRSAQEQASAGMSVTLTDIQDGDLVFFFDNDSHVGLYVGNGMMVHAPGPGSLIREESIFGAGESAIHRVIRPA